MVSIIDNGYNVYTISDKKAYELFAKHITPLDIISQVANETEMELVHELNLEYVEQLERGLMSALDLLSKTKKGFDYYETLRELTGFDNFMALDFLDMFGDKEEEE